MRRTVPLARRAQTLLQAAETGCPVSSTAHPAASVRAYAAAQQGSAPSKPAADASPAPGSPTAAAQAAIKAANAGSGAAAGSNTSSTATSSTPAGPGPSADSSSICGGGGGGWVLPVLTLAAAGGGYYVYTQQADQGQLQQMSQERLDATQKAALDLLNKSKARVQALLPPFLGGSEKADTPAVSSSTSSSKSDALQQQKQRDQQESGFKMLPPGSEDAAVTTAAADAATAASAAARDSLSAAADEFPGSTAGASAAAGEQGGAAGVVELEGLGTLMDVTTIDITPISQLFADVTGVAPSTASSSSSSSSSGGLPQKAAAAPTDAAAAQLAASVAAMQSAPAAAAAAAAAPSAAAVGSGVAVESVGLREVEDSELDKLCSKLGLTKDLAPSGLVAAANKAGLGPTNSAGAHLPPQMAQLNQATADARVLREVMEAAAAQTASLLQELADARKHTAWTEEAANKREEALTEHFKELMREQSRIHQQLTAAAVREAEAVLAADTAKAHLQERGERLQAIDALRDKVNALALAFEQRTAQLRSAQDVNKVSLGMSSLSKALEEGTPIGTQLQQLAASCPDDPLVEAVAASLPPSAATEGLPTHTQLQQRFADVAQAAAEAAYFSGQEAQGGVLAHLAAKLAARLKVDAGADVDNSVDSKLSQARALLQQGQLSAAAEVLMAAAEGTQAASVVQQWVADARARAAADQAVKLLQAHATATASLTS